MWKRTFFGRALELGTDEVKRLAKTKKNHFSEESRFECSDTIVKIYMKRIGNTVGET